MAPKKTNKIGKGVLHVPTDHTRELVKSLTLAGAGHDIIARILKISDKSLRAHYRKELDETMPQANAQIVGKLYQSAMEGSVPAQIYWTKARLGWRDTQALEITGKDGQAIELVARPDKIGIEEWATYWDQKRAKELLEKN